MTTPNAAATPPREAEGGERRGRGAAGARVGVSALCLAAAALVPFDDLLRGALTGLASLVAIVLARPMTNRIWSPLADATGVLLAAAAVTAVVRFVVPAIDAASPVVRIGAYLVFLALYVGYFVVYGRV